MKKLILILLVGGLFAQDELSNTDKMILFQAEKKDVLTAVALEFVLPYGGYKYLDKSLHKIKTPTSIIRWSSGVTALMFYAYGNIEKDNDHAWYVGCQAADDYGCNKYSQTVYELYGVGHFFAGVYSLLTFIQTYDLMNQTKAYNHNLYKSILGKELPKIGFNLQPTYKGVNLTMSFALD